MEAVRTSETSVDNHFKRQYIPEDNSEHHTRRRENLKSQICPLVAAVQTRSLTPSKSIIRSINESLGYFRATPSAIPEK
jgi:hypothetical protein